jgi:hypothetical protein
MELFLPGLFVLVITAFFAFLVVPRIGPTILAIVSLIALIAAGVHHINLFYSEYRLSTWQQGLADAAPWVVLATAIIFIIASIGVLFSNRMTGASNTPMASIQNAISNSMASTPSASTATNPITAAINSTLTTIGNAGAAVGNTVSKAVSGNKKNNSYLGFPASRI